MNSDSSPQSPCLVFVYGTLKPNHSNYQQYCANQVISAQPAIALGQIFALPMGYPAMIEGNNQVHGYLLTFADSNILKSLDQLEDYQSDRPAAENLYTRQWIEVLTPTGNSLGFAWAYLMTAEQVNQFQGVLQKEGIWNPLFQN